MVRRVQLGAALRRYRGAAGLSIKEVADRLLGSSSKITRIEKGQRNPTLRDVRDLCEIYGIPEGAAQQLMELARESRERAWWQEADLDPALQTLIGMEGSAKAISEFEALALPGLLQTQEYANAVLDVWIPEDSDRQQKALDVRMRRQEIFREEAPPEMRVVVDEAALRRVVGGRSVMRRQLDHLSTLVADSAVQIQVISFAAGPHLGMNNGFTVLEFGRAASPVGEPAIPAVVYVETLDDMTYLDQPAQVQRYLDAFKRLSAQALPVDESAVLLRSVAREF
jgi:transcriptional regulator with XRE-family HTH domain